MPIEIKVEFLARHRPGPKYLLGQTQEVKF